MYFVMQNLLHKLWKKVNFFYNCFTTFIQSLFIAFCMLYIQIFIVAIYTSCQKDKRKVPPKPDHRRKSVNFNSFFQSYLH